MRRKEGWKLESLPFAVCHLSWNVFEVREEGEEDVEEEGKFAVGR
jgi:hypothetical protein